VSNLAYNLDQYPHIQELVIVGKTEWLTLAAAAKLPECTVTGNTLREMILRGDVPEGRWMESPYGDSVIYLIDKAILPYLPYRKRGGQEKDKT
jgi:hypothetical protein